MNLLGSSVLRSPKSPSLGARCRLRQVWQHMCKTDLLDMYSRLTRHVYDLFNYIRLSYMINECHAKLRVRCICTQPLHSQMTRGAVLLNAILVSEQYPPANIQMPNIQCQVPSVESQLRSKRLRWYGHVCRQADDRLT